jgi:hypothetical protein
MPPRDQLVQRVQALCAGLHVSPNDFHQALADAQRGGMNPDVVAEVARAAAGRDLRLRCGHALESFRVVGPAGSFCGACVAEWSP